MGTELVAQRCQRPPVAAKVALEGGVDAGAGLLDLVARDRLAVVAERIDHGPVAAQIRNGVQPQRRFRQQSPARRSELELAFEVQVTPLSALGETMKVPTRMPTGA